MISKLSKQFIEKVQAVATLLQRRMDVVWAGEEVADYEVVRKQAIQADQTLPEFVKDALRKLLFQ